MSTGKCTSPKPAVCECCSRVEVEGASAAHRRSRGAQCAGVGMRAPGTFQAGHGRPGRRVHSGISSLCCLCKIKLSDITQFLGRSCFLFSLGKCCFEYPFSSERYFRPPQAPSCRKPGSPLAEQGGECQAVARTASRGAPLPTTAPALHKYTEDVGESCFKRLNSPKRRKSKQSGRRISVASLKCYLLGQ